MRYQNDVKKDAREILDTARIILNEFDCNYLNIRRSCYVGWHIAEKERKPDLAKSLKDMYVTLVKNQIVILGFPIFQN